MSFVGCRTRTARTATLLDLLTIAVTGPKARLQMGVWMSSDGSVDSVNTFVRANQGHGLRFVREERVAKIKDSLEALLDSVEDLWHGTFFANTTDILMRGLVPGGELGDRNSVYLTPVSPWNQGFEDASRKGVDVFVRVDPEVLIRSVSTRISHADGERHSHCARCDRPQSHRQCGCEASGRLSSPLAPRFGRPVADDIRSGNNAEPSYMADGG